MQRLNKLLAHLGVASRRGADAVIAEGRITVNGETVADLGRQVDPETDDIRLDGERLATGRVRYHYLALNKPRDVITTLSDPQGRPTVADFVPKELRLAPVGRLDGATEGLLLLTNDGDLAYELTHPRHLHEKEYRVKISGSPTEAAMKAWRGGMYLKEEDENERRASRAASAAAAAALASGIDAPAPKTPAAIAPAKPRTSTEGRRAEGARLRKTLPAIVKITSSTGSGTWLRFTLTEGRNRQIRRMIEPFKHTIHRLIRIRVGPIRLENMKPGQWRRLSDQEIAALKGDAEALAALEAAAAPKRAAKPIYKAGWAKPKLKADKPRSDRSRSDRLGPDGLKLEKPVVDRSGPEKPVADRPAAEAAPATRGALADQPTAPRAPRAKPGEDRQARPKREPRRSDRSAGDDRPAPRKPERPAVDGRGRRAAGARADDRVEAAKGRGGRRADGAGAGRGPRDAAAAGGSRKAGVGGAPKGRGKAPGQGRGRAKGGASRGGGR